MSNCIGESWESGADPSQAMVATGTASAATDILTAGEWGPENGMAPAMYDRTTAGADAVTYDNRADDVIRRTDDADSNTKAGWTNEVAGTTSWGANNPDQSDL